MSLVQNPIDALYNGVSQQPANMRLPSQAEEQVNCYSSVADGLTKRPPTEFLAKVSSDTYTDAFIHIINRDSTEQYAVVITDETVEVYDLSDGSAETVEFVAYQTWEASTTYSRTDVVIPTTSNGFAYRKTNNGDDTSGASEPTWPTTIGDTVTDGGVTWTCVPHYFAVPAGQKPRDIFSVVTVADYSFVVNKTVEVQTYELPTALPSNQSAWFFPDNWGRADVGSRYYAPAYGIDQGTVQTLQDLPALDGDPAPDEGDYYTIAGSDADGFSKYYVYFYDEVWQETHEKDNGIALDENTMPHALIRESDGTFRIRQFGWIPRLFGDDISNPAPSFVGKTISAIGYHKNRLVVASGENVVFSCAGDYGNFFRNTVTQLLDADVVDVAVSTQQVAEINHVLPAENGFMFFSDSAQYSLNVDELLTPSTVSIDVATTYEMNPLVPPIAVGPDVFYVTETGDFSHVREYSFASGDSLQTDAVDITAHVRRYLPKNAFRLVGSSNDDIMLVLSEETGYRNRAYVYKFFYSGGEKIQSSWSYWEFAEGDVILDASVLNSQIYFLIERSDGVYLETMDVQSTTFPSGLAFDINIDRRWQVDTASYDGVSKTTIDLPYEVPSALRDDFLFVEGDGDNPGRLVPSSDILGWNSNTQVELKDDYTGVTLYAGLNYEARYKFSRQYHRRPDGQTITTGRYQLRTFTVVYEDMAVFSTRVDPYGSGYSLTEDIVTAGLSDFTGKTVGHESLNLNEPNFEDGEYAFQIYGDSKVASVELIMDQPYSGAFVSATVEGFYTTRR